jgi:hypothetical protein
MSSLYNTTRKDELMEMNVEHKWTIITLNKICVFIHVIYKYKKIKDMCKVKEIRKTGKWWNLIWDEKGPDVFGNKVTLSTEKPDKIVQCHWNYI